MSEPTTPLLSAGALTLFGIATGINPVFLAAGFIGCWWYNTYIPELTVGKRITAGLIAAFFATWVTTPLVAWLAGLESWPARVDATMIGFPIAMIIGFLTHRVIGPQLLRIAQKKAEEIA